MAAPYKYLYHYDSGSRETDTCDLMSKPSAFWVSPDDVELFALFDKLNQANQTPRPAAERDFLHIKQAELTGGSRSRSRDLCMTDRTG